MTAIQIHLNLNGYKDASGLIYESCLVAALKNSRQVTARNLDTGYPDPLASQGYLGSWIGAMGYITILDQIGKCYRPENQNKITSNISSIEKALFYFTNLQSNEIKAIYALRNAFFHDFSLINKDKTTNFHRFRLDNHDYNPVVILPMQPWDGDLNNFTSTNETYVNLKSLGDMVENIYKKLIHFESNKTLILDLPGGEDELFLRYFFTHN